MIAASPPLDIARSYIARGWAPVPIPDRSKRPLLDGWQNLRITQETATEHFNGRPQNIGVILGDASGGLVDVDLDCAEAIELADAYLPATRSFGRASRRRSHREFIVTDCGETIRFTDPVSKGVLVELRATGGQTVFPGSTHVEGETIEWEDDLPIATLAWADAVRLVSRLAAASLLRRHAPDADVEDPATWRVLPPRAVTKLHEWLGVPRSTEQAQDIADRVYRASAPTPECSISMASRMSRALAYETKLPPAISGQGGHAATMRAATVFVRGFHLGTEKGLEVLEVYNRRAEPPWSSRELRHKAREAARVGDMAWGAKLVDTATSNDGPEPRTASFKLTELGNSERLVARFGDRVRFCDARGGWFVWDGATWRRDTTREVHRLAKIVVRDLWAEAARCGDADVRDAFLSHARKSEKASAIAAMLKLAESAAGVAVDGQAFDADPWVLCCRNGLLDLETGELTDHDSAAMCTKLAPVTFDPAAQCPRWLQFLEEILPDPDVRTFVQRFAGYCMTGVIRDRALVLLIGGGRNGKSVFIKVLVQLLGDYAAYAAPDVLMSSDHHRHPTELADLAGIRFAAMSETKKDRAFDEETLKRLTGAEPIKARFMNKDFFTFDMNAKLAMAANHRPRVRDNTDSIWDRIREVPFTVRIDEAHEDKQLFEKLLAELPGVLNWALVGCREWQRCGLGAPSAVRAATRAYRDGEDPLAGFFADCVAFDPGAMVSRSELRRAYERWSEEQGERWKVSARELVQAMREKGAEESTRGGLRIWIGVRISVPS